MVHRTVPLMLFLVGCGADPCVPTVGRYLATWAERPGGTCEVAATTESTLGPVSICGPTGLLPLAVCASVIHSACAVPGGGVSRWDGTLAWSDGNARASGVIDAQAIGTAAPCSGRYDVTLERL